jgi:TonB family protein
VVCFAKYSTTHNLQTAAELGVMKESMKYLISILFATVFSAETFGETKSTNINCIEYCESIEKCSKLIAENVANNWSRPPVKDIYEMQVTLKVSLAKNGAIENIAIEKSSGNEKFDNSALLAFRKTGGFCEIQGLSDEDYEKDFKSVTFTFSPQSIRN